METRSRPVEARCEGGCEGAGPGGPIFGSAPVYPWIRACVSSNWSLHIRSQLISGQPIRSGPTPITDIAILGLWSDLWIGVGPEFFPTESRTGAGWDIPCPWTSCGERSWRRLGLVRPEHWRGPGTHAQHVLDSVFVAHGHNCGSTALMEGRQTPRRRSKEAFLGARAPVSFSNGRV